MDLKLIDELEKRDAEEVLAGLESKSSQTAIEAATGLKLEAASYGLNFRDYLRAAVKPEGQLDGYETALKFMNLPVRDDLKENVSLRAASDTFYSKPGSRVLFPEVVLDVANWKTKQDEVETVEPMIAQTRTVVGTNQIIWMELDDSNTDHSMNTIAEGAEIPRKKIGYSSRSVKFFKIGAGYEFTYEFQRRASIDILTPFVNRMNRQMEIDKVKHATSILMNGDNVAGAITAKAETDYGGTNGTLDYKSLLKWLVARAKAGYPVDTLIGNYETYVDFVLLFEPVAGGTTTIQAIAQRLGMDIDTTPLSLPFLNQTVRFAISSTVPASTVIGITRGETMEELVEAGSDIAETERLITSQRIVFVRSQNIGYNLVTPLARESFSWAS